MARPTLHYLSHFEPSGYGLSAIATVRALRNAGYPIRWTPLKRVGYDQLALNSWPQALADASDWLRGDESLADVHSLVAATANTPLNSETGYTVAHVVPEHLSPVFALAAVSSHFERVAYTTWESDALPLHWLGCFDGCHRIVVPSTFNQAVFSRDLGRTVHAVPHVRRHRNNEFTGTELAQLRRNLNIAPDAFVFYSINQLEPRKGWARLVEAFVRAFDASDKVVLLIKSSHSGWGDAPYFDQVTARDYFQQMLARLATQIKVNLPQICLVDELRMSGRAIEALHGVGDCFVSLTHGEGFAMSACDAACLGKPVLMTGWGGQHDFLGREHGGNIPHTLVSAPVWPAERPSFWPSQRWAEASIPHAAELMKKVVSEPDGFRASAQRLCEQIHMNLSEPSVALSWENALRTA